MTYVITEITQAVRNADRVNVFLNGAFWIGISKNDLLSLKLLKGQELTLAEKRDIEVTAGKNKLIERAILYAQLRPRSIGEMRDYLIYKRSLSKEEAEQIIAILIEKGFLNDEKFAQWFIDVKLNSGVTGINKLKMELLKKHVDSKLIASLLHEIHNNDEFRQEQKTKIEEYALKIIPGIKAKDQYDLKTKLIQRLLSRGFTFSDIKEAIMAPAIQSLLSPVTV